MSIPLYILTGFLGSGKTTFLKRVLDKYADTSKLGIIQNEFAPLNVDAVELNRLGKSFELMEVNRGSVFCVCLVADFKTGLRDFVDAHQPDAVFLEASGLSDPIAVVEILQAPELQDRVHLAKIWSVVDASSFLLMEQSNLRMRHQVRVADVVIVNKTDKVEAETTMQVDKRVRRINPLAEIVQTSFCDLDVQLSGPLMTPLAVRDRDNLDIDQAQPRPAIGTAVVKSTKKISRPALDLFLLEQSAKAFRLKGHVQLDDGSAVMVQITNGDCQLSIIPNYLGPTELIAIGSDIVAKDFSSQFRNYCL